MMMRNISLNFDFQQRLTILILRIKNKFAIFLRIKVLFTREMQKPEFKKNIRVFVPILKQEVTNS